MLSFVVLLLLLFSTRTTVAMPVNCVRTVDCETILMKGSVCNAGVCSNPFYEHGCLGSMMMAETPPPQAESSTADDTPPSAFAMARKRVCNSDDPPEAAATGHCQAPDPALGYTEIRIATQNWESVFLEAWMLQIVLQEVVGVPVTLETGSPHVQLDFYHSDMAYGWGTGNDWSMVEATREIHADCRHVPRFVETEKSNIDATTTTGHSNDAATIYQPCAHVIPEVWATQSHNLAQLQREGTIEAPLGLGVIGQQGWFIPRFVAQHDPTLLTYFGLAGEQNRRKLAETFLRPTTWGDYCTHVSLTVCQLPDVVASRAPVNDQEASLYFAGFDTFTGHFRKTEENDCDTHPDTCTGHIADYPCGWSSFVEQQAYHLDIALRSSGKEPGCRGYKYGELVQIAAAANPTKSPVVMEWWTPDALYQTYSQTDMEFHAVSLPPPTQQCMEATVTPEDRCHENQAVRVGKPEGACAEVSCETLINGFV